MPLSAVVRAADEWTPDEWMNEMPPQRRMDRWLHGIGQGLEEAPTWPATAL